VTGHWLQSRLTDAFESALVEVDRVSAASAMYASAPAAIDKEGRRRDAERQAADLLERALANGLKDVAFTSEMTAVSGGAAADFVIRARAGLSFIVKVQNTPKIKEEVRWLKYARSGDASLWAKHLPRVFADQMEHPPYAYVMEDFRAEDGFRDLATWIFDSELVPEAREAQASALLAYAVNVLLSIYRGTVNANSITNVEGEAYLGRIRNRMQEAAELFAGFDDAEVVLSDATLPSWRSLLNRLAAHKERLVQVMAPFETAVHGDPHPGNLLIRLPPKGAGDVEIDLRIIDPKGWNQGDYIFDLAKLAHYLEATGPLERWKLSATCSFELSSGRLSVPALSAVPPWLSELAKMIRRRAESLSEELGDSGAAYRFELAMASNLLGLVATRYKSDPNLAVALYVRGLSWLNTFVEHVLPRRADP
jgi:hypothetical protein